MPEKKIALHKKQAEAFFAKERFIAAVAGLQSGKTLLGAVWSRHKWDSYPDRDGLICAPSYKILSQSTLPKFFEINEDLLKYWKKSENLIEVPGRGKIYIRSTENPNVIEGMTLRWIWADEAGQMKLQAWINFQGRVSIQKGDIFLTTTPYTLNWMYTDFYERAKEKHKDYRLVQWKSKDNPYFPKEEYERVKSTMDPRVFRRRYDGLFEKPEGLVYETPDIVEPHEIKEADVIAGVDWGFTNPTAIIVVKIDKDAHFTVVEEWYHTHKVEEEILAAMRRLQDLHKITKWYPDPEDAAKIEAAKRAGFHCMEVNKDIKNGIDKVRNVMAENRLHIFNTCPNTIDEFNTYHYPEEEDGKADSEIPIKLYDHALDALRYAIVGYGPDRHLRGRTKVVFHGY